MEIQELDDIKKIKNEYGEEMSHFCHDNFSTILEKSGVLYYLVSLHFAKSRDLYPDIVSQEQENFFKTYIYSLYYEMYPQEKKNNQINP